MSQTASSSHPHHVQQFVSRGDFIQARCTQRSVLHLGCIGSTGNSLEEHIAAMLAGRELHTLLRATARNITGIDNNAPAVHALNKQGFPEIITGDVERLDEIPLTGTFDVVVCGHLLHYLSHPGLMLEGVKRFMHAESELIITVPNAMGLVRFSKYALRRSFAGSAWILAFTPNTLTNLLRRHHFTPTTLHTCYNSAPLFEATGLRYTLGIRFFRLFPKFGATLLAIARLSPPSHQ